MKKLLILLLALVMCLTALTSCDQVLGMFWQPTEPTPEVETTDADLAIQFLNTKYKDYQVKASRDYELVKNVQGGSTNFEITWTTSLETINIVVGENAVTVDLPDANAEEVAFTLTATITDANGNTYSKNFERTLPAYTAGPMSVADALKLEDGMDVFVAGTVTEINTSWSDDYKNITVTITDANGDSLYVYRMNTKVVVGDYIEITGKMGSYNGSKQVAAGSTAKITDPAPVEVTAAEAVAMEDGRRVIVTGTVTEINTEYNEQYGNITVTITDENGDTLYVYRLKGNVELGTKITVSGRVGSYKGAKQIAAGATFEVAVDETPVILGVVDPVAGQAYKFGMVQGNLENAIYYLKGGMDGYYMATTTDAAEALDVYLEETEGGYYLYCFVGETKTYINCVVSGEHVNGAYEATASTVYTYNSESKTIVAKVNGEDYWFGTRNDKTYTTVGPCKVSYNGFYCQFYGELEEAPAHECESVCPACKKCTDADCTEAVCTEKCEGHVVNTVEAAQLPDGTVVTVSGTVVKINTAWSDDFGNISVTIADENGTLYLFRLATKVVVGDTITVNGKVGSYNGSKQIAQGATATVGEHVHVYYNETKVDATCTTAGSITYTCPCGEVSEDVDVLPMAHTKDANGLCTVCNKWTFDSTLDHGAMDEETKANGDTAVFGAFTVHYKTSTKVDGSSKKFDDGFTGTHRLSIGGKTEVKDGLVCGAISFTVTEATTLKVWWVCGGDGRAIGLYTLGEDGKLVAPTTTYGTDSVKNTLYITEIEVPAAGTYYFGASGSNNYYKFELDAPEADTPVAEKVTASKTIAELITSEGWTSSTTKQEFKLDDKVTVKVNGGSNTGKAYDGDHIRIYATDSPAGTLTISVPEGYELVSVKISTVTGTYAFLYVGEGTTDICNTTVEVSGSSVVLNSVKNGSDGKQVRVTAIEVVYQAVTE